MGLFQTQFVGVDLTAKSVRVVGVKGGSKPSFIGCKEIMLPEQGVSKEGLHDPDYLGHTIKQCFEQAAPKHLAPSRIVTAVSELQVFRKVIELPDQLKGSELMGAIRLEVTQYLPEEIELSELDYQVLSVDTKNKTQQIMVVTVPKKIVQQYQQALQASGFPLAAIDVRSAALGRAVVEAKEKKGMVLVNIEEDATVVSVYQGDAVRVTSSLALGIEDVEKEEVTNSMISALVDEIDHVIKFYANRSVEHEEVKEILLAGSGSLLKGLKEGLAKQVQLPINQAKPIITVPAFCDRRFLVALGCALYPIDLES